MTEPTVTQADRDAFASVYEELNAEITRLTTALKKAEAKNTVAEKVAKAGVLVSDAAYHGDECPMNTTGAYCNCGFEEASNAWDAVFAEWKGLTDGNP